MLERWKIFIVNPVNTDFDVAIESVSINRVLVFKELNLAGENVKAFSPQEKSKLSTEITSIKFQYQSGCPAAMQGLTVLPCITESDI